MRLDKFEINQDIVYDYKLDLTRPGSRSMVDVDDNLVL